MFSNLTSPQPAEEAEAGIPTACLHTGKAWETPNKGQEEVKKASGIKGKLGGGGRMPGHGNE